MRPPVLTGGGPVSAPVSAPAGVSTRPKPWDLLMICAAIYVLTAVARVHQMYSVLTAVKPLLVFSALGLLVFLADKNKARKAKLLKDPTSKAVAFIMLWATVGVPFGLVQGTAIAFLHQEAYRVGILFLLVAAAVRDLHDVRRMMYVYGGGIAYLAFVAMARSVGGVRLGGGSSYDPNDLGMVLVSAIPIGIYALTRARGFHHKLFAGVALFSLAVAMVGTDSRGAFLAFVAVVGYTLFLLDGVKKSWRVGAAAGVLGLMLYAASGSYWERMRTIFVPEDDYNRTSLTGRVEIWKRGMGYMLTHPIFGVGVNNFMSAEGRSDIIASRQAEGHGTKWSTAHSSWVQIGAELGIPGLVALIVFYFGGIERLRRLARLTRDRLAPREVKEGAAMAAALMGVFIALVVGGSFVSQAFGYAVFAAAGMVAGLLKVMALGGVDSARLGRRPPVHRGAGPAASGPPLHGAR